MQRGQCSIELVGGRGKCEPALNGLPLVPGVRHITVRTRSLVRPPPPRRMAAPCSLLQPHILDIAMIYMCVYMFIYYIYL